MATKATTVSPGYIRKHKGYMGEKDEKLPKYKSMNKGGTVKSIQDIRDRYKKRMEK